MRIHTHGVLAFLSLVSLLFGSDIAQATLVDRGGGLIYDDVANLTWLQDASYARTSGASSDGRLDWTQAVAWADQLSFGGYDDWRLPSAGSNPCFQCGTSEFSVLFNAHGIRVPAPALNDPLGNPGPFTNLPIHAAYFDSVTFWTGSADGTDSAWAYTFSGPGHWADYLGSTGTGSLFYVWAVRRGDVAAIPEPESHAMLIVGLGLLTLFARPSRQEAA